jgi:hypothetical protein
MWQWIAAHWNQLAMGTGIAGGAFGLPKLIPRMWKSFATFLAAPVLLEIEREKNRAREEQVADLLEELDWRRKLSEIRGGSKGGEHLP